MKPLAEIKLISGNSNRPLAQAIAEKMGRGLSETLVQRYADNEIWVEIEDNMRGEDAFVIQSTSRPANDNLMELLIIIDALKRSSAGRISALIPYYGYARQDRKPAPRTPISAKLVANLITQAGADRVLTVDLHSGQIQGFFDIPTDNLTAAPVFAKHCQFLFPKDTNPMIISPDVGGLVRARIFAKLIEADLAVIDKRREKAGVVESMHVIGEVSGRTCILYDDICDSAGTLCRAADALMGKGAAEVHAFCTHGVLSNGAVKRIEDSALKSVMITDSIEPTEEVLASDHLNVVSLAPMLTEAVYATARYDSVSRLFKDAPIS